MISYPSPTPATVEALRGPSLGNIWFAHQADLFSETLSMPGHSRYNEQE